jgi:hypothetical protein
MIKTLALKCHILGGVEHNEAKNKTYKQIALAFLPFVTHPL